MLALMTMVILSRKYPYAGLNCREPKAAERMHSMRNQFNNNELT
jgi:hypothetical protein